MADEIDRKTAMSLTYPKIRELISANTSLSAFLREAGMDLNADPPKPPRLALVIQLMESSFREQVVQNKLDARDVLQFVDVYERTERDDFAVAETRYSQSGNVHLLQTPGKKRTLAFVELGHAAPAGFKHVSDLSLSNSELAVLQNHRLFPIVPPDGVHYAGVAGLEFNMAQHDYGHLEGFRRRPSYLTALLRAYDRDPTGTTLEKDGKPTARSQRLFFVAEFLSGFCAGCVDAYHDIFRSLSLTLPTPANAQFLTRDEIADWMRQQSAGTMFTLFRQLNDALPRLVEPLGGAANDGVTSALAPTGDFSKAAAASLIPFQRGMWQEYLDRGLSTHAIDFLTILDFYSRTSPEQWVDVAGAVVVDRRNVINMWIATSGVFSRSGLENYKFANYWFNDSVGH